MATISRRSFLKAIPAAGLMLTAPAIIKHAPTSRRSEADLDRIEAEYQAWLQEAPGYVTNMYEGLLMEFLDSYDRDGEAGADNWQAISDRRLAEFHRIASPETKTWVRYNYQKWHKRSPLWQLAGRR